MVVFSEVNALSQHLFSDLNRAVIMAGTRNMWVFLQERVNEVLRRGLTAAARGQLVLLDHVGTNIMSLNKTTTEKA